MTATVSSMRWLRLLLSLVALLVHQMRLTEALGFAASSKVEPCQLRGSLHDQRLQAQTYARYITGFGYYLI